MGTGDSSGTSLIVPGKREETVEGGEAPPGGPSSPVCVFPFKNRGRSASDPLQGMQNEETTGAFLACWVLSVFNMWVEEVL